MKQLAFLEYTFMFEPSSTWDHVFQFEHDLANFFAAHGYEAQIVKTIDGQVGRRILFIQAIATPAMVKNAQENAQNNGKVIPLEPNKSPKSQVKELLRK